jgi:tRNA(Ile)-lysidine synthase
VALTEDLVARAPLLREFADQHVIVACSGGPDSSALVALAAAVGVHVHVVHVDHGLRAGAAAEAELVARTASRFGLPAVSVGIAVEPGPNLEARARTQRYGVLEEQRRALGAIAVLVGHTMDDQAETVVLALMRGSGTAGLAGMAAVREHVVRPLLGLRRHELAALCAELGLETLDDPMNHEERFRRVAVRRRVLPELGAISGRDLVPVIARQAALLREENDFLDALAADALADAGDPPRAAVLRALDPVLARRVVRLLLGSPPAPLASVDDVLAVIRGDRLAVEVPGGRRVRRSRGRIVVEGQAPVAAVPRALGQP